MYPSLSLLLCGTDPDLASLAAAAGKKIADAATLVPLRAAELTAARPAAAEPELVVLENPAAGEAARVAAVLDGAALPRWPVVVLGRNGDDGAAVPRDEWEPRLLARVLRGALSEHRLRRELAQLRGDFLTIGFRINHDLRTPLGCIATMTDLLRETLASDEAQLKLLRPISDSVEGTVNLIARVASVAKASAGALALQSVNMGEAFQAALAQLHDELARAGAAVAPPPDWPAVAGDSRSLQIVWANLLENALRHGGAAPRIEAGWHRTSADFHFWIRDSGAGVAPARRASLFQPFHRLHATDAVRGLGLPIVRRLIELQGGGCGHDPAAGASYFFFTMPADAIASTAAARTHPNNSLS